LATDETQRQKFLQLAEDGRDIAADYESVTGNPDLPSDRSEATPSARVLALSPPSVP